MEGGPGKAKAKEGSKSTTLVRCITVACQQQQQQLEETPMQADISRTSLRRMRKEVFSRDQNFASLHSVLAAASERKGERANPILLPGRTQVQSDAYLGVVLFFYGRPLLTARPLVDCP